MKREDILKQLKKEKDPLKYLEKLLKETKDKSLKKEIGKLIEKLKKVTEKKEPPKSLEETVSNISIRSQQVPTETLEDYQSRTRVRAPTFPFSPETKARPSEDYGSNIKSDYLTSKSDIKKSLEGSHLISGFTTTAESQEAIKQKLGDKATEYNLNGENFKQYSETNFREEQRMERETIGMSQEQKQAHKRKQLNYHG